MEEEEGGGAKAPVREEEVVKAKVKNKDTEEALNGDHAGGDGEKEASKEKNGKGEEKLTSYSFR